ncbi:hypothetical protein GCM10012285_23810 [Streptomyces kronopolitis]|uniref:Uncharacterized protein n=1 Tax=Streptomyces kronopolitis TaxID=1612435 RepID=A0ABQ2JCD1_9ACTN|nr:hypothetical protein GCM10012285_23810 [Streptomyces kronopolitis]
MLRGDVMKRALSRIDDRPANPRTSYLKLQVTLPTIHSTPAANNSHSAHRAGEEACPQPGAFVGHRAGGGGVEYVRSVRQWPVGS